MNSTSEYNDVSNETKRQARCLIDDIVAYLKSRRHTDAADAEPKEVNEERLLRALLRHLRHNPLPTALLGVATAWLLLAGEEEEEEEEEELGLESGLAPRIETELIRQVKGGYAHTNRRLREVVDHYPWAAAAAIVGSGILAAVLLPDRGASTRAEPSYLDREPEEDETMPGEKGLSD